MAIFIFTSLLYLTGMRQQTCRKLFWDQFVNDEGTHRLRWIERKTINAKVSKAKVIEIPDEYFVLIEEYKKAVVPARIDWLKKWAKESDFKTWLNEQKLSRHKFEADYETWKTNGFGEKYQFVFSFLQGSAVQELTKTIKNENKDIFG